METKKREAKSLSFNKINLFDYISPYSGLVVNVPVYVLSPSS